MTGQQRALIIVDVQNDFCEGGSLAVSGGAQVAAGVARLVREHAGDYAQIVATADWHIDPGSHWSETPDFVDSWPVHCRAGSPGAEFHPELAPALPSIAEVFRKGEYQASYSGFEGHAAGGDHAELAAWLHEHGITEVDVVGIATDHCVRATALDAVRAGFDTSVLTGLTAGVAAEPTAAALSDMADAGVHLR